MTFVQVHFLQAQGQVEFTFIFVISEHFSGFCLLRFSIRRRQGQGCRVGFTLRLVSGKVPEQSSILVILKNVSSPVFYTEHMFYLNLTRELNVRSSGLPPWATWVGVELSLESQNLLSACRFFPALLEEVCGIYTIFPSLPTLDHCHRNEMFHEKEHHQPTEINSSALSNIVSFSIILFSCSVVIFLSSQPVGQKWFTQLVCYNGKSITQDTPGSKFYFGKVIKMDLKKKSGSWPR